MGIDIGPGKHINICPLIHKYVGQHEWGADMSGHVRFIQMEKWFQIPLFFCVWAVVSINQESAFSQWLNLNTDTHGWKKKKNLLAGLAALTVKMDTTAGMSYSLWSAEGRQVLNAMAVASQLKTSSRWREHISAAWPDLDLSKLLWSSSLPHARSNCGYTITLIVCIHCKPAFLWWAMEQTHLW